MDDKRKMAFEAARDSTKQFLTLATGIIALTITFSKDFAGAEAGLKILVFLAWILLLVSVLFGLCVLLALTGTLEPIDPSTPNSIRGKNVIIPASLQIVTFFLGLALTVAFGISAI